MRLLISLFIILCTIACKKESENLPPIIHITTSIDGATYRPGDTVLIEADIEDDHLIKSLKLSLIETTTKKTAGIVKSFQINADRYSLSYSYVLKNKGLKSGKYYFELLADDGKKQTAAFVSINIQQKVQQRLGLIFISSNQGEVELFKQTSVTTFEKIVSLDLAYADAKINDIDQQLWVMPKGKSDLVVYDLQSASIVNRIPAPTTQSQDAFSTLYYDDRAFFVGTNNGTLQAYNYQFTDIFTYTAAQQYNVKHIVANAKYILLVEQAQQFNISRIRLLYRISGGVISSGLLQKNIVGLQLLSKDRAYLISKSTSGIEILDYDVKRGVSRQLLYRNNANERLIAFEKLNSGQFLFATNLGLFKFTPPSQLLTISQRPVKNVNYDKLRDEILMVNKDTLHVFNASSSLHKQTIIFSKKLQAVLPWNNR